MNRALDLAQLRGAQYADIRVVNNLTEAITVRNGIIEAFNLAETTGFGVRLLVDGSGTVTLDRSYQPYGNVLSSTGGGATSYGYAGEWRDTTGMVYLRARYYMPGVGRFISRDTWAGDANQPMSYNAWAYVYADPINHTDPSGLSPIIPQEPPDHRDLTLWLYEEMSTNANGYYAQ
jgi:RHS repeat-associated protein